MIPVLTFISIFNYGRASRASRGVTAGQGDQGRGHGRPVAQAIRQPRPLTVACGRRITEPFMDRDIDFFKLIYSHK